MFEEIIKNYKKQAIKAAAGRLATSIMVIVFTVLAVVMVEYAIPSKDINLIISIRSYIFWS